MSTLKENEFLSNKNVLEMKKRNALMIIEKKINGKKIIKTIGLKRMNDMLRSNKNRMEVRKRERKKEKA